jgi:hypothetical protein
MKRTLLIAILASNAHYIVAQTTTYHDMWILFLNHYELNNRWSLGSEIHLRSTRFLKNKEQLLFRPFVSYRKDDNLFLSLGYSFINSFPYKSSDIPLTKQEHNVWEQLVIKHKLGSYSLSHRYRIEHRFKVRLVRDQKQEVERKGIDFVNRFRYRLTLKRLINAHFFVHAFDELWLNTNKHFGYNSFDRNWWYVGLGYRFDNKSSIELAYLHQYIGTEVNAYETHPTIQLSWLYDFIRKKK